MIGEIIAKAKTENGSEITLTKDGTKYYLEVIDQEGNESYEYDYYFKSYKNAINEFTLAWENQ